jgi:hypothetical protein
VEIDWGDRVGRYPSVAIDNRGRPYVCYFQPFRLRGTVWNGGDDWDVYDVTDDAVEGPITMATKYNRKHAYVVYVHDDGIGYATWTGSKWFDNFTNVLPGDEPSVIYDSRGVPFVATRYISPTLDGSIRLGIGDSYPWRLDTVYYKQGGLTMSDPSIALDADESPVVCFDYQGLAFAGMVGEEWEVDTVPGTAMMGRDPSLAFSSDNEPWVSHAGILPMLSHREGDEWTTHTIDESATDCRRTSLALDSEGNPAVAWLDVTGPDSSRLMLSRYDGLSWSTETIDEGNLYGNGTGFDLKLCFDTIDHPAIAWYDYGSDAVMLYWWY